MLSKGHGRTMRTYELLLQAFDEEGCVEEADALFEKILTENEECTPQNLFHHVIAMHERYNQPKRLLQVVTFLKSSMEKARALELPANPYPQKHYNTSTLLVQKEGPPINSQIVM